MKEIKWPDRLMTWLRMGDQAMELRFRREPNLFSDNNYFLYQIQIGMSIPKDLFFSLPAEHAIYIGAGRVFLANNPHPIKHIEVEKVDENYLTTLNGVRLKLKVIPKNIR